MLTLARRAATASRLAPLQLARPLSTGAGMSAKSIRQQSTAIADFDEEAEWEVSWLAATEEVYDSSRSFQDSAAGLRQLIKRDLAVVVAIEELPDLKLLGRCTCELDHRESCIELPLAQAATVVAINRVKGTAKGHVVDRGCHVP